METAPVTIKQEIAKAKTVQVLLERAYTDRLSCIRLTVSKPEARRLVDATPKDQPPTAKWEENGNLVLVPSVSDE